MDDWHTPDSRGLRGTENSATETLSHRDFHKENWLLRLDSPTLAATEARHGTIHSIPRRSFASLESSEQLAQTPLADLQFRLRLAHRVALFVGRPREEDDEQARVPPPAVVSGER